MTFPSPKSHGIGWKYDSPKAGARLSLRSAVRWTPDGQSLLTASPWVQRSPDGRTLLLHVLTHADESELVRSIKTHYERPLMEIFQ